MKMTGNTILITGGTSGIGFELARQLGQNNTVVITGRDQARLYQAGAKLGNVPAIQSLATVTASEGRPCSARSPSRPGAEIPELPQENRQAPRRCRPVDTLQGFQELFLATPEGEIT